MALQVTRIAVDNFKSLEGFELNLAKFVCLVGLNGAGKSTVLQCFDFLARQCQGDIEGWLTNRNWSASDLNSRLTHKSNIDFEVDLSPEAGQVLHWEASFNRKELRCTRESITFNGQQLLKVEDGQLMVASENATARRIDFTYQGSVLSQLKEAQLPPMLKDFKYFFQKNIQALDMLSPALLRQRTRHAKGGLGMGGESLSAYLHEIGPGERTIITSKLKEAYPHLGGINVVSMKSGWKKLQITELYTGRALSTEARHVSDGLLRMLAVFSQLNRPSSFMLLDEIENGINPELIELLLDSLVQSRHQVMVTTHSPMILNYLEDDTARQGVIYLYKTPEGHTRAVRLFSIPSMAEKLTAMGPGEAYEDTILTQLGAEINDMRGGKA